MSKAKNASENVLEHPEVYSTDTIVELWKVMVAQKFSPKSLPLILHCLLVQYKFSAEQIVFMLNLIDFNVPDKDPSFVLSEILSDKFLARISILSVDQLFDVGVVAKNDDVWVWLIRTGKFSRQDLLRIGKTVNSYSFEKSDKIWKSIIATDDFWGDQTSFKELIDISSTIAVVETGKFSYEEMIEIGKVFENLKLWNVVVAQKKLPQKELFEIAKERHSILLGDQEFWDDETSTEDLCEICKSLNRPYIFVKIVRTNKLSVEQLLSLINLCSIDQYVLAEITQKYKLSSKQLAEVIEKCIWGAFQEVDGKIVGIPAKIIAEGIKDLSSKQLITLGNKCDEVYVWIIIINTGKLSEKQLFKVARSKNDLWSFVFCALCKKEDPVSKVLEIAERANHREFWHNVLLRYSFTPEQLVYVAQKGAYVPDVMFKSKDSSLEQVVEIVKTLQPKDDMEHIQKDAMWRDIFGNRFEIYV